MKITITIAGVSMNIFTLLACAGLSVPLFSYAQTKARFLSSIVSTDSLEFNAAFSADGNHFYFSRSINKQTRIFITTKSGNTWSVAEPVPISIEKYSDADPALSPEGELYFISNRPSHANDTTMDYDIWKVTSISSGRWSEPINVRSLNSSKDEFYISFTNEGDVYFASSREGGFGEEDIYFSQRKNNVYGVPRNLGNNINSAYSEYDPFITSNGSALIFTSSGRKDSFGKADLYWSVNEKEGWGKTMHFGREINTATRDYCPYISRDLKNFFFSSEGDVKFIATDALPPELQPRLKLNND
jgi:hypothetical protein